MPTLIRSHIGVRRSDGFTAGSMAAACRALMGTTTEISDAESRRIRAQLRRGAASVRDSRGYSWIATQITEMIDPTVTRITNAVAIAWDQLTFGVELEVTASERVPMGDRIVQITNALLPLNLRGWRVVRDGSVSNGAEVVSPVLKGEQGLAELKQICDALKAAGFTAQRTCGMHVHVGAREFSVGQLSNVCRSMLNNEAHFDSIVAPSRRLNNNHYCQSHRGYSVPNRATTVSGLAREFNGGWDSQRHYTPFRYRKLNLQSYACHGTLEFRQHQGTVESERAVAWVRLVTGFFAAAINGQTAAMTFDQFAALAGNQASYIHQRRSYFAQRQQRAAA